jgi:hypothetical protein
MYGLSKSGLDIQRLFYPYLYRLNRKRRRIATLFPDIIERRTDKSIVRLRYEVMAAQYPLGIHPFYATERRVAAGELRNHDLLFAPESDFVCDEAYEQTVRFVARGGKVVLAPGGFAHNEYGDPRDTAALIRPNTGDPLCEGATVYKLGKGEVVCMNALERRADLQTDGSEVCASAASVDNVRRRKLYYRVLQAAMDRYGLNDAVAIVPPDPRSIPWNIDWRYLKIGGKHILAVVHHGWGDRPPLACRLRSKLVIQGATDLISGERSSVKPFRIPFGPHLYELDVARTGWLWRRDATQDASGSDQGEAEERREQLERMHGDLILQP